MSVFHLYYGNPHGLSNRYNKSIALDLEILCKNAMNNKLFK